MALGIDTWERVRVSATCGIRGKATKGTTRKEREALHHNSMKDEPLAVSEIQGTKGMWLAGCGEGGRVVRKMCH